MHISRRQLTNIYSLLLAFALCTNAKGLLKLDEHDPRQLAPQYAEFFAPGHHPASLKTGVTLPPTAELDLRFGESSLSKRQGPDLGELWKRLRIGGLCILWSNTRLDALSNPNTSPPSQFIQYLKQMYTQIRTAAINEWAKLPEQSYVRITFGYLIMTILPPADSTVPWGLVQDVAYMALLVVSAGLGGLVTGTFLPTVTGVAVYCYLQVIAPVPPGQGGSEGGSKSNSLV